MEYSEEQIRVFQEEWGKHRQTRILVSILLVVGAIGFAVFSDLAKKTPQVDFVTLGLFLAFLIGGVVFLILTSRCPACGAIVGRPYRARYCDQCGVPLRS